MEQIMEQDGFKTVIKENGEHILVDCTKEAINGWDNIIEVPKDVTSINPSAFSVFYSPLKIRINSYSLIPDLIASRISRNAKIYDYNYSNFCWVSLETLAKLYELYPASFEANQDGKCLFDNNNTVSFKDEDYSIVRLIDDQRNTVVVLAQSRALEEIPYSVTFKQDSFISDFHSRDSIEYSHWGRWNGVEGTTYAVDAFVGLDSNVSSSSSIVIPSSISTVIIDGGRRLGKLTFTGPLPNHIYLGKDIKVNDLYINEPKNDVMRHPAYASLKSAVEGSVFYAAPSLCDEESINPGYIRLTESHRLKYRDEEDKIIEINTFFIASVEAYEIDCYSPVVGTLLSLAIDDKSERKYEYLVYEPMDVVQKKIRESLDRIDVRYLAFQVDSWNKYKEGE